MIKQVWKSVLNVIIIIIIIIIVIIIIIIIIIIITGDSLRLCRVLFSTQSARF